MGDQGFEEYWSTVRRHIMRTDGHDLAGDEISRLMRSKTTAIAVAWKNEDNPQTLADLLLIEHNEGL